MALAPCSRINQSATADASEAPTSAQPELPPISVRPPCCAPSAKRTFVPTCWLVVGARERVASVAFRRWSVPLVCTAMSSGKVTSVGEGIPLRLRCGAGTRENRREFCVQRLVHDHQPLCKYSTFADKPLPSRTRSPDWDDNRAVIAATRGPHLSCSSVGRCSHPDRPRLLGDICRSGG